MKKILISRQWNLLLGAKKLDLIIDKKLVYKIDNGKTKELKAPQKSKEMIAKIKKYEVTIQLIESDILEKFEIKFNIYFLIATYGMGLFVLINIITKFILKIDEPLFIYLLIPFLLVSLYYSTFGKKKVLLLIKK
ncbi:hypothetical protein [uncultured Aquimarina sp.]|uniref:hypothetical protein n=1 Tax=uncultured Aquimarina sp. TaxID=575652 RepID=UPI002621133E|nr:hypothetical protein [uncultured Aquimarina sp.]